MNSIIKNILALIGGGLVGMVVNMGLIITGNQLIPFSDNINPMNAMNWETKYFIFHFLHMQLGHYQEHLSLQCSQQVIICYLQSA